MAHRPELLLLRNVVGAEVARSAEAAQGERAHSEVRRKLMDWDDVRPQPKREIIVGASLEALSIEELEARIVALQGEIERVRATLTARRSQQQAADAIFKR
jgi:uncharacterized small protein (DUF1192 family)